MEQEPKFDYFYGCQSEQYSFYRIPKVLFTNEYFRPLSCEAKVLYGLLLDRMALSMKNQWMDEQNRVYIIFTIEEVMEYLSCSRQKAVKVFAELDNQKGIGLVEKKRLGLGRANILYVKNFMIGEACEKYADKTSCGDPGKLIDIQKYENHTSRSSENVLQEVPDAYDKEYEKQTTESMESILHKVPEIDFKKYENHTSGSMENRLQEVPKSYANNTDKSKTNKSQNDFSENEGSNIKSYPILSGKNNALDAYREIISDNIEYPIVAEMYGKEMADEIVELILEILTSKRKIFRLAGEEMDANLVKDRFMKLRFSHVMYVCECMKKNTTKIQNIKQYLLTSLYNAPATMNHYYQMEVQHDMYG
ncbi:MAG: replication initiator protein A [Lachnospiraceae bacterium]|nr:replication initiator protein A [Lachnospiraceae bacterium]